MDKPINERAQDWLNSGKTGASSKTVCAFFLGQDIPSPSYPHDFGDFSRCMGLLNRVPEFEPRMAELAALPGVVGTVWGAIADNWASLKEVYDTGSQEGFYNLLQGIIRPLEDNSGEVARLKMKGGINATMSIPKAYSAKIATPDEVKAGTDTKPVGNDHLYASAVILVTTENKVSTSFIQRHLKIGYNTAASLVERMEKEGIVTPANHVGHRHITEKAAKAVEVVGKILTVSENTGVPPEQVLNKAKEQIGMGHNSKAPQNVGGVSGDRLKAYIERVERLTEEKDGIAEDIRDIYSEAKSAGFDTKVMREMVKLRKMDSQKRIEHEELVDLYKSAIGLL